MIDGYAQQDSGHDAVELFEVMQEEGIEPNCATFVGLLKTCCRTADLGQGKLVHVHIVESGSKLDSIVGSSLIGMHLKCGNLKDARLVFNKFPKQNIATWSTIITGYAQHEHAQEALCHFHHM